MYLAIDIGGTKTLVALFNSDRKITQKQEFKTNQSYSQFKKDLLECTTLLKVETSKIKSVVAGAPADIDYQTQTLILLNNLKWRNVQLGNDLKSIFGGSVHIGNDAKLAAIGEAVIGAGKPYNRVLYITLSTGIGTGFTVDGHLEPFYEKTEGGHILCYYDNQIINWEELASGNTFHKIYKQYARDVKDVKIWNDYAHRLAIGFGTLNSIYRPDVIVVGGSLGAYLPKFKAELIRIITEKRAIQTPLAPIVKAHDPEQAVIYGCYVVANRGKL